MIHFVKEKQAYLVLVWLEYSVYSPSFVRLEACRTVLQVVYPLQMKFVYFVRGYIGFTLSVKC